MIVELARRSRRAWVAGDLVRAVIADHRPVEFPAGIDGPASVLYFQPHLCSQRNYPPDQIASRKGMQRLIVMPLLLGADMLQVMGERLRNHSGSTVFAGLVRR